MLTSLFKQYSHRTTSSDNEVIIHYTASSVFKQIQLSISNFEHKTAAIFTTSIYLI